MAVVALPRSFGLLAGANLAAQSAEQLSLAATPIVAVLLLGAGPGEVGVLATAQTIPFLLLSIPFGLLADRSPRRALMVAAELLRALALLKDLRWQWQLSAAPGYTASRSGEVLSLRQVLPWWDFARCKPSGHST